MADKVWLRSPEFFAAAQLSRDEIVELIATAQAVDEVGSGPWPVVAVEAGSTESDNGAADARSAMPMSALVEARDEAARGSAEPPESPEAAAERERRYRELFGIPEPRPRRRWRR